MAGKAELSCAWIGQQFIIVVGTLLFLGIVSAPADVAHSVDQDAPDLQNHILGIGNCPPWKPQSVEVCNNSLRTVVNALAPRVDAGADNIHLLINEGASATALKRKATELANRLGSNDRLLIYANLPLGASDADPETVSEGYVLELWAGEKPASSSTAISSGTWISASAFAAMIHAIPAAEAILILDTNNSHPISMHLFAANSVDHKDRPEALISSSGTGQTANYSADRSISLFAKHLALALNEIEGSLHEAIMAAAGGTRQAAIPICAALTEQGNQSAEQQRGCTQVPEIHDPEALLSRTMLIPIAESGLPE